MAVLTLFIAQDEDCSLIANPNEELLLECRKGNVRRVEFILKFCNGTDVNSALILAIEADNECRYMCKFSQVG